MDVDEAVENLYICVQIEKLSDLVNFALCKARFR